METLHKTESEEPIKRQIEFVTACLRKLAAIKAAELGDERIDGYVRALIDLSELQLGYAFKRALAEITFFPQVAEIRKFAMEYLRTPEAIAAKEKRDREIEERTLAAYKQRKLEGREPKQLRSMLELSHEERQQIEGGAA